MELEVEILEDEEKAEEEEEEKVENSTKLNDRQSKNSGEENETEEEKDEEGKQTNVLAPLTRENLKYNFFVFRIFSKLEGYPFKVEKNGGKFYIEEKNRWHSFIFTFWRTLTLLQGIFSTVRTIHSLTMGEELFSKNLHHLPVMIINTAIVLVINYQIANVANFWPKLNLKFANEFFMDPNQREAEIGDENQGKDKKTSPEEKKVESRGNRKKKLREMNEMELLLCLFPFLFNQAILIMPMLYILEPDLPVLFCSVLGEWRNWYTIGICFLFDFINFEFNGAYIHYTIYFNVSFIINMIYNIKQEIKKLRSKSDEVVAKLSEACKNLEVLKLRLSLFNVGFCTWVYITKIVAMTVTIFSGFAAIRLIKTNPLFGVMYFLIFLNANSGYIGVFNVGFSIANLMEELKIKIVKKSQRVDLKWKRNEIQKRVRAVRKNMGIKMGSFHDLERNSTLIFVDFAVQQIVALLLAFP